MTDRECYSIQNLHQFMIYGRRVQPLFANNLPHRPCLIADELKECNCFFGGSHLRQVTTAEETIALFQLIRDEAGTVGEVICEKGLNPPAVNHELMEVLDGITFAVSHDLRRVFEPEQRTNESQKSSLSVVGKLFRSHDLLTNCLQQSTVTLAMVFAPEMVGARLFNNSDLRFRQSLQLCHDLTELLQLIDDYDKHSDH